MDVTSSFEPASAKRPRLPKHEPTLGSFEIVVPVLNEERELREKIVELVCFLHTSYPPSQAWQVTIADNGSADSTPAIGKSLAEELSRVVYQRTDKAGVGLALKKAWSASHADVVGYMDLDLATDLDHLRQALPAIFVDGADVVYGTRLHADSQVRGRSAKREFISRSLNSVLRLYLRTRVSDVTCGFKFFRRRCLPFLLRQGAVSDGWFLPAELVVVAEREGLSLLELPVRWTDSADSRVRVLPLSLEYLRAMRKLKQGPASLSMDASRSPVRESPTHIFPSRGRM